MHTTLGPGANPSQLYTGALDRAPLNIPSVSHRRKRPGDRPMPAGPVERPEETTRRKEAQKSVRMKILPRPKAEILDVFLRRLDAHREAENAIILPLVPPEDNMMTVRRLMVVKKLSEKSNVIVLPRTSRETDTEFAARLACCEKSPCGLVLSRGAHESGSDFKLRCLCAARVGVWV